MPNHVTNILTINGTKKQVKEVLKAIEGDESLLDFEKIIPMPQDILRDNLSSADMKRTNGRNWYDWSIEYWGTKWNAYSVSLEGNVLTFDTAWATPTPVFEALSKMFPKVTFSLRYADEDLGHNLGYVEYLGGEEIESVTYKGKKALKFACEVKGLDYDEEVAERKRYEEEGKNV